MNKLLAAAWEFHQFLTESSIPYAIIGGLAVQYWGEPRVTLDVDLTVSIPIEKSEPLIREIVRRFPSRIG